MSSRLPFSLFLLGSLAVAGHPDSSQSSAAKPSDAPVAADNSATNARDRAPAEPTADQQKNSKSDVDLTARIRRAVVADKSLSTNAHNIKIITQNGAVTLKGPVASENEKHLVEQKASELAGQDHVTSEIQVKR